MSTIVEQTGVRLEQLGRQRIAAELKFGDFVVVVTDTTITSGRVVPPKRTSATGSTVMIAEPWHLPIERGDSALFFVTDAAPRPTDRQERRRQTAIKRSLGLEPKDDLPRRLDQILDPVPSLTPGFGFEHEGGTLVLGDWHGWSVKTRRLERVEIVNDGSGTQTIGHLEGGGTTQAAWSWQPIQAPQRHPS